MPSALKTFFVISTFFATSSAQNLTISEALKTVFLSKPINSSDLEWMFKSAKESYNLLKMIKGKPEDGEKLLFAQKYANYLLELHNDFQTKDLDIHQLFSSEISFLKDNIHPNTSSTVDVDFAKVRSAIEAMLMAMQKHLTPYYIANYNSDKAIKVLEMNESSSDIFFRNQFKNDFSNIGYFLLEVFATLIGLSWGLVSTILYTASDNATQSISTVPLTE